MAKGRKTGGRVKGTPNKATVMRKEAFKLGRETLYQFLDDYKNSGLMAADFADLEPKDRLSIAEKFMQYCMPKLQATAVDVNTDNKHSELIERLESLCDDE